MKGEAMKEMRMRIRFWGVITAVFGIGCVIGSVYLSFLKEPAQAHAMMALAVVCGTVSQLLVLVAKELTGGDGE